jgi:hypothetical protein
MEKNRKLDILISEYIFDKEVYETDDCNGEDNYWLDKNSENELPFYSSSIEEAWKVMDQVRKIHWRDVVSLFSPTDESKLWFCHFEKKWHGRDGSVVEIYDMESGETAPLAICLAALRALDIKI